MNLLEVMKDVFKPFGNKDMPIHIGEAYNLWTYLAALQETLRISILCRNLAHDPELTKKIDDLDNNILRPTIDEIQDFMTKNQIELPHESAIPPILKEYRAPSGGELTDEQIANLAVFNVAIQINYGCQFATESLNPEVGTIFIKSMVKLMAFGATLKSLLYQNGWLKIPPEYKP